MSKFCQRCGTEMQETETTCARCGYTGNNRPTPPPPPGKEAHGCLTAWLVLMIIGNVFAAVSYLFASETIRKTYPNMPDWALVALIVLLTGNIISVVALFMWKKWGFFGCIVSSALGLVVNMVSGLNPVFAMFSAALGIGILYGVLQIGARKGWDQLE